MYALIGNETVSVENFTLRVDAFDAAGLKAV
jgi:hypothetical protein